ncbi:MAG TPA: protein-L-isoaspartate(D-aspartate) O-methyltransferase [Gemmatimonadota bacterium]|nr:protein-L-isoaspartate(D-aspartate) O-methyltransferase [Gemmatimonadota bacterium]
MAARQAERLAMVRGQIEARGIRDPAVLRAMREVPREAFVSPDQVEFAYQDSPLPIAEDQTISQPYMVALMAAVLEIEPGDRVLEVGTGSGYAAAILSRIAGEVYTVERHGALAEGARRVLESLGYSNVHVLHGDGTRGWPEHAPYDGIVVAAGGPDVPHALRDQLAIGGRLVIPVGPTPRLQELARVTRVSQSEFAREDLGGVRFVPLVGTEGWRESGGTLLRSAAALSEDSARAIVRETAEPFGDIDDAELGPLIERMGDARVVLLGEATHGTSEFYRMRARITGELVERHGFRIVAVEADWPDAATIDERVRSTEHPPSQREGFARFPTWMWRNREVAAFVEWLRERNLSLPPQERAGFYGLDLYSLHSSIDRVLRYLDDVDPDAARVARQRYGCLSPWEADPVAYGRMVLSGRYRACEPEVTAMLQDLLSRRLEYLSRDGTRFLDAVQNARLVANAEQYYRAMYYGGTESWNLRDTHMFNTLRLLLDYHGADSRAVVWAHNSHLGVASATEMGARGELNLGQLCREDFGGRSFHVGFGTHTGTVAAASEWGGAMEIMDVRPSHERSYERVCHDSEVEAFVLHLREPRRDALREELLEPRLERAIGVVYRPVAELASHYFQAVLPRQFDEWIWFDETTAVTPLAPTPERATS